MFIKIKKDFGLLVKQELQSSLGRLVKMGIFTRLSKEEKAIITSFRLEEAKFTVTIHSIHDLANTTGFDSLKIESAFNSLVNKKLLFWIESKTTHSKSSDKKFRREYGITNEGRTYHMLRMWEKATLTLTTTAAIASIIAVFKP